MNDLTRQELCVRLHVSESTVRRLEARGMPYTKTEWSLHVPANLQVLTFIENGQKHNYFEAGA